MSAPSLLDISGFLATLYAGCTSGYLSIWTRQDKKTAFFDVQSFGAAAEHSLERANAGYDVYFGTGLRRHALDENSRGGKADVQWLTCAWLDVDVKGPGHKGVDLPATLEEAGAVVDLCPLPPSVLVDTGGGVHAYWLLDSPLEVGSKHTSVNAAFKAWQKRIIRAAKERWGWKIDATANIDRVLRLPDTWNCKVEPRRPVRSIYFEEVRYDPWKLLGSTKPLEQESRAAAASTPGDVPADLVDEVKRRLRHLANQENRELMGGVLCGEPFATGERDILLQRAASCVAFVVPERYVASADAAALAQIFAGTVAAMEAEHEAALARGEADSGNPPPSMDDAVDKVSRALDDKARRVRLDAEMRAEFLGGTGAAGAGAGAAGTEPTESGTEQVNGHVNGHVEAVEFYTTEQLADFSTWAGVSAEEFRRRWIIQHESSFYVFAGGRYLSPVGKESLLTHLRDDLAPAERLGVRLQTWTQKGDERQKTVPEVLKEYATAARHLRGSLCVDRSRYDEPSDTFWESICPPRELEPEFNDRVDHWLRLLGGYQAEKLLDWIATVLRLDLQSSALYVSGVAGSGKTMLAHGLSRLWSEGGPSLLEDVADTSFNADIARCPLVLGDEQVKCSTSELRRLVGSSSHVLKRKYLSNVDLEGALRIVLADNSGKLIEGDGLSGADMGAVASKFLHVEARDAPAKYLRSIGGRNVGTKDWVDGDVIARHALWLAFNRSVELGNRLAVEGAMDRMTELLLVSDRVTGTICEWISRYVDDPISSVSQFNGAAVGDGKILISAETIHRFFTSYSSERNTFSLTKIGRALHNLSDSKIELVKQVKAGKSIKRRMHSVNPKYVLAWMERNLSCDVDEFRTKIMNGVNKDDK